MVKGCSIRLALYSCANQMATTSMMKYCLVVALVIASWTLSLASASQFTTTDVCNYTFSFGELPNFRLPEAGPNSPGDIQLNPGNDIITKGWVEGESDPLHSCTGESSAYYVGNDTWNTTYLSNDGDELEVDVFYAAFQKQLWVRHLQPPMDPSLYEVLNGTTVRLNVTCGPLDQISCLEFTVNFTEATPYNYTAPYEFVDDCYHGFSSGERVPSFVVHAASPVGPTTSASLRTGNALILAGKADQGLPWSEGFHENGTQKSDEFWAEWWSIIESRYDAHVESDPCNEVGGIIDVRKRVCCPTACNACMGSDYYFGDNHCGRLSILNKGFGVCGANNRAPCELRTYAYLGCFADNQDGGRTMVKNRSLTFMRTAICANRCKGSRQFGLQYGTECWCGPTDADADYDMFGVTTNCDMECVGEDGTICGGYNAMSTYQYRQEAIRANALEANAEMGCTGRSSKFWNSRTGEWVSKFETVDGESHDIDMFYMNVVNGVNELWVTEINSWMAPSLYIHLQHNYVKLSLTCPVGNVAVDSCVIFKPTFTNWSPDIVGASAGYRFADPAIPSFDLPGAIPNSPGDVLLTTNNSIVTKTGAKTETYCNGDTAEYSGEDGHWYSKFVKSNGEVHELKHVFYALQRNLYAATIQANWEPKLRGLLAGRIVRLQVHCTNDERAENLFIRVAGEPATCDDIEGLCTDVAEGDTLQLPVFNLGAATLSMAYLMWLFTGG